MQSENSAIAVHVNPGRMRVEVSKPSLELASACRLPICDHGIHPAPGGEPNLIFRPYRGEGQVEA